MRSLLKASTSSDALPAAAGFMFEGGAAETTSSVRSKVASVFWNGFNGAPEGLTGTGSGGSASSSEIFDASEFELSNGSKAAWGAASFRRTGSSSGDSGGGVCNRTRFTGFV
jgi:hypothetical protein